MGHNLSHKLQELLEQHHKKQGLRTEFLVDFSPRQVAMIIFSGLLHELQMLGVVSGPDRHISSIGLLMYRRLLFEAKKYPSEAEFLEIAMHPELPDSPLFGDRSPETRVRAVRLVMRALNEGVLNLREQRYDRNFAPIVGAGAEDGGGVA